MTCNLVFTYPQEIIKFKKENNRKYDTEGDKESYLGIYEQIYKRAQRYIKNIQKYKPSGKYLDVGCSYGIYIKAAKDAGFDSYGVEIASVAAKYARDEFHLNVFTGTLEKAKYRSNTFDIITLYDVLEHVPNIREFLQEIYRILKPEGLVVIQCPNIESCAFKILNRDWNWLLVPYHLWHFSRKSLSKILSRNNFSVIQYTTWDSSYDFASNWVTKMGLTIPNGSLPRRLLRKSIYIFLRFGIILGSYLWSRYNKGGSQILYATKNEK